VASLFRESVALKRNLEWLPQLYSRALDTHAQDWAKAEDEYERVLAVINHLLPSPVKIETVDTRRVYFSAPGTPRVELSELSDGFRSFLALVIDLLRQIADAFGEVGRFVTFAEDHRPAVDVDGIVLIDEVDQHLHPTWQRTIGPGLVSVFPRIQFIVTSHSPLIAQAARTDGLFVLRARTVAEPVEVLRPRSNVSGWPVEQLLLDPQLFGLTDTRSTRVEDLLNEHAALRGKQRFTGALDGQESARLASLERDLAHLLTAPGEQDRAALAEAMQAAATRLKEHAASGPPPAR
jgi:hypothetical protein